MTDLVARALSLAEATTKIINAKHLEDDAEGLHTRSEGLARIAAELEPPARSDVLMREGGMSTGRDQERSGGERRGPGCCGGFRQHRARLASPGRGSRSSWRSGR